LDGTYDASEPAFNIEVNFDEPVIAVGIPTLDLNIGGGYTINYVAGSGTSTLFFSYQIQNGHESADLSYIASSLAGTITALDDGTPANLASLPTPSAANSLSFNKALVIQDLTGPSIVSVTTTKPDGSYAAPETMQIVVTFDEPIDAGGAETLTLDDGMGTATFNSVSADNLSIIFDYTVLGTDNTAEIDAFSIAGVIDDQTVANNGAILGSLPNGATTGSLQNNANIIIDNTGPVCTITALTNNWSNATVNESLAFNCTDALTSVDGLTYECNFNAGGWGPCSNAPLFHQFAAVEAAGQTLDVRVNDILGNTSASALYTFGIDQTGTNATALGWAQGGPSTSSTSLDPQWTPAVDALSGLGTQDVTYFANATCTGPALGSSTGLAAATNTINIAGPLGDGDYSFNVTSVDLAGNSITSGCSTIEVDSTVPTCTISTAIDWTNANPYTVNFTCSDNGGSPLTAWECSTNETGAWSAYGACDSSTTHQLSGFTEGATRGLRVRAVNAAAITGSPDEELFGFDNTAPANATALGWTEGAYDNDGDIQANWTVSAATISGLADQDINLYSASGCGGGATTTAGIGTGATHNFTDLADATYSYTITTYDNAGNSNTSGCSADIIVDSVQPTISDIRSVVTPDSNVYTFGANIDIEVLFSEPVVLSGGGTECIDLNLAGLSNACAITSASSTTHTFRYTVKAGDSSFDLDYLGTGPFSLGAGYIRDASGLNADLTTTVPGTGGSISFNDEIRVWGDDAFISTWSGPGTYTLPLRSGFNYNFVVYWGDGTSDVVTAWNDADATHTYAGAGPYTMTIVGLVEAWYFNNAGDKDAILTVPNLGDVGWINFENAFRGCSNLTAFNGGVTTNVTDMSGMFRDAPITIPNTNSWNTSNVTNMQGMFWNATAANPNTSLWNTANVVNFSFMFDGATNAVPDTSGWNTSSANTMANMFNNASNANPEVDGWNVSGVTNMSYMFQGATNATLTAGTGTSTWDTSSVNNMSFMFSFAPSANPDTSGWETQNVTNMEYMFNGATSATPVTTTLGNVWNTSNVTTMRNMFAGATSANPDVSGWDVSNISIFQGAFQGAISANPNTSSWDTSSATIMTSMFAGASMQPDMSSWNFANVINMINMFEGNTQPILAFSNFLVKVEAENSNATVTLGFNDPAQQCNPAGVQARTDLIADHTWTIDPCTAATGPVISSVRSASTPDSSEYNTGGTINIEVVFDQLVNVSDPTQVCLELDLQGGKTVCNPTGSGSTTLTFTYTVVDGDYHFDLDYTSNAALTIGTATIQNTSLANANVTLPNPGAANSISATDAIKVNGSTCPMGYVPVPKNETTGTWNDFCVAKFHMTNNAGNADVLPGVASWASISQNDARTECSNLGANYQLISNEEWMTIARNVEGRGENWDGGTPGTNSLNRGHHEDTPASYVTPAASDSNACAGVTITGTCDYTTWNIEKRTFRLDNGHNVWDLSGNYFEWMDYNVPQAQQPGVANWQEVDGLAGTIAMPAQSHQPTIGGLTFAANGIGQFFNGVGGAMMRGGARSGAGSRAGMYNMNFFQVATDSPVYTTFRCTYHPIVEAYVTNVDSPDTGSFTTGQTIRINVTFDQNVTVTGTPRLLMETGATDNYATYNGTGSGTSTIQFDYVVQAADVNTDLDYAHILALENNAGSTIMAGGAHADLKLQIPGNAGSLAANESLVLGASGFNGHVNQICESIKYPGDIYVVGGFTTYNGSPAPGIIRLNSDLSIDAAFNPGTGFTGTLSTYSHPFNCAEAIDGSGDVYVVGDFVNYQGVSRPGAVRLNDDGSFDAGFNLGSGLNAFGKVILQPRDGSGDVIILGRQTQRNGVNLNSLHITRFNSDGTEDTAYDAGEPFGTGTGRWLMEQNLLTMGVEQSLLQPMRASLLIEHLKSMLISQWIQLIMPQHQIQVIGWKMWFLTILI
jgi:hypothetical protein